MSIPHLRRATPADLPRLVEADARAFGLTYEDADVTEFSALFDPDRFWVATEEGDHSEDARIIGTTGDFCFTVTLPGGAQVPAPGVTWVSVALDQRRRGVLRALFERQHRTFAQDGVVASFLTASEGGIYGRFGYGPATTRVSVELDRHRAHLRDDLPQGSPVRHLDSALVRAHARDVHERWCAVTPGALSRSDAWWDVALADRPAHRGGSSALFQLAHADGWVAYRIDDLGEGGNRCRVVAFFAATDAAHVALWRALLSLDLVASITAEVSGPDDPLPLLLTDHRQVRTTGSRDGLWVRLLDVPAALAARRYAVEVDAVLDVDDAFLGLGGRFRLRGGPDGAQCERVGDAAAPGGSGASGASGADLRLGVAALGSVWLGGHRLSTAARAGLVAADDPRVLSRLDAAFTTDRSPRHGTEF